MPETDNHELQSKTAGGAKPETQTKPHVEPDGVPEESPGSVPGMTKGKKPEPVGNTQKNENPESPVTSSGETDLTSPVGDALKLEEPPVAETAEPLKNPTEEADGTENSKTAESETPSSVSTQSNKTAESTESVENPKEVIEENEGAQIADSTETTLDDQEADIDKSNAEDAEDQENQRRHHIPFLDYHSLSMENLVGELQRLMRTEKVQSIRRHVEAIRQEFNQKFRAFIEEKREEFVGRGGEESDFSYNSVTKRQFNELYAEYREKRSQYYKNLEKQLKENLEERLAIIEDLKGLVSVEEDMNSTYKSFKEIQGRWKKAGPIPRDKYNDVWRTYQHHLEIFYDFLSLNRELRDLDFKHNFEEKEKLCLRAEALLEQEDINKAFRELQILHKIWKEDIGPVSKEHREAIWERFSEATRKMHELRQKHYQDLDKRFEANLQEKQKIIAQIEALSETVAKNHKGIQKQIREIEALREKFFNAGKVPQKDNEATWASFKGAVRKFNRSKNSFYKSLKKEQQENLDLKRALLEQATALKDSEEWQTATSEMKRIQREWKEIGHVPRKYSDAIWKEFKSACNHYFDRLHSTKNSAFAEEKKNLQQKSKLLDDLRSFQLTGKREQDLETIQKYIGHWKGIGHVPRNKKHVNSKFHKILDALFRKLDVGKQEAEILKYGNRIADLAKEEDTRAIEQERQFVRKKIEEVKGEIRQLENNLNFFSDPSEDNPLVKEVLDNLENKKVGLENWMTKLKKLNILRNSLKNEKTNSDESDAPDTETSV